MYPNKARAGAGTDAGRSCWQREGSSETERLERPSLQAPPPPPPPPPRRGRDPRKFGRPGAAQGRQLGALHVDSSAGARRDRRHESKFMGPRPFLALLQRAFAGRPAACVAASGIASRSLPEGPARTEGLCSRVCDENLTNSPVLEKSRGRGGKLIRPWLEGKKAGPSHKIKKKSGFEAAAISKH